MKALFLLLVLASCVVLHTTLPAGAVLVRTPDGDGCAAFTEYGVLTARHVVDGALLIRVSNGNVEVPARVEEIPAGADLAWLSLRKPLDAGALPAGDFTEIGQEVTVHGCRSGERKAVVLGAREGLLALSGLPMRGDSGSPVVDARGRIVGIVVARGERVTWVEAIYNKGD